MKVPDRREAESEQKAIGVSKTGGRILAVGDTSKAEWIIFNRE